MAKHYKYQHQLVNERPNSFSAVVFYAQIGVKEVVLVIETGTIKPKTPQAVAHWAAEQKLPPPLWCEWEKTETIPEERDEWHDVGPTGVDDYGDEYHGWVPARAYARTEATVQFAGEECPRRLNVIYVWMYQTYIDLHERPQIGLPRTNGGTYVINEIK